MGPISNFNLFTTVAIQLASCIANIAVHGNVIGFNEFANVNLVPVQIIGSGSSSL